MTLVRFQPAPNKSLLTNFWNLPTDGSVTTQPVVNTIETPAGFRIEVAAPGLSKEDFKVNVEQNVLTISAEKDTAHTEEGVTFHRREFAYGTFERKFRLPDSIDPDQVVATFLNGILSVHLVKKAETKPEIKNITIG